MCADLARSVWPTMQTCLSHVHSKQFSLSSYYSQFFFANDAVHLSATCKEPDNWLARQIGMNATRPRSKVA